MNTHGSFTHHRTRTTFVFILVYIIIVIFGLRSGGQIQTQPSDAATYTLTTIGLTSAGESSGLVASRQYANVYWWMRDGGTSTADKPRNAIYALKVDSSGIQNVRGSDKYPFFLVNGETNNNWEDIAIDSSNNIWIGDIGANKCSRNNQALIKVAEPNPAGTSSLNVLARYTFKFPDPASGCNTWNSEAMFWFEGKLYIVAKNSVSGIYRIDLPSGTSGTAKLVKLGNITGVTKQSAASVSDDKTRFLTAGHLKMFVFKPSSASLSGDAYIKDVISRSPAYQAVFECKCTLNKGTVEGGSFAKGSRNVAYVSENKQIYFATPSAYGDGATTPPPPPPVDTTNPNASISSPTASQTVKGTITVTASATDNVGVSRVVFKAAGITLSTDTTSPYSATWDTNTVSDGSYSVSAQAFDAAGNSDISSRTVTVDNVVANPIINSFSASPASIYVGEYTTLMWNTSNVSTCSVDPNGPQGTTATSWRTPTYTSTGTRTYTLTCRNSAGTTTQRTAQVAVAAQPTPPSKPRLSSSKTVVEKNESFVLSWVSSGAESCTLNPGGIQSSGGTGSLQQQITATTTYKVTCRNNAGSSTSDGLSITVSSTPPPPATPSITTFAANPSKIKKGETSVLSWTTSNAVACSLTPSSLGSTTPRGNWTTPVLSESMSYTLSCVNSVGQKVNKSTSVTVGSDAPPPAPKPAPVTPTTGEDETVEATTGETVTNAQNTPETEGLVTLDSSNVTDEDKIDQIVRVEYYSGEKLIQTVEKAPFALDTTRLTDGDYTITERVYYNDGSVSEKTQTIVVENNNLVNTLRGTWYTFFTTPTGLLTGLGGLAAVGGVFYTRTFWQRVAWTTGGWIKRYIQIGGYQPFDLPKQPPVQPPVDPAVPPHDPRADLFK